jgi:excisionase family DNA binding protein
METSRIALAAAIDACDITPKRLTITVGQAGATLGLSPATIWMMLADGRLESITYGRRRLVLWESVENFVQSRRGIRGDARRNGDAGVPALGTRPGKRPRKTLDLPILVKDLELSTRSKNALGNASVETISQLVPYTEQELRKLPNLGVTSLTEIRTLLKKHGLHLGMEIPEPDRVAPPEPARRKKARKDGTDLR